MKKLFLIFTVLFTCLSPVICTATSLHESFEQNQPQTNEIAPKATDSKKRASMLLDAMAELCDTEGYTSTSNTMAQL
ncbi:MAG: hypothetical protein II332_00755, partial [Kiritimatiellae bacterium]|nr:hypothetical protein [Kiritimatiellia bacterium]